MTQRKKHGETGGRAGAETCLVQIISDSLQRPNVLEDEVKVPKAATLVTGPKLWRKIADAVPCNIHPYAAVQRVGVNLRCGPNHRQLPRRVAETVRSRLSARRPRGIRTGTQKQGEE